jgi:hypothetical protein
MLFSAFWTPRGKGASGQKSLSTKRSTMKSQQETSVELAYETAQEQFRRLLAEYRHNALWFMKGDVTVDITDSDADRILDLIACKASRTNWLTIRKLKEWRSLNFK